MGQLGRDRPALTIGGRQDVLFIFSYTPTTHVEGSHHDINMHVAIIVAYYISIAGNQTIKNDFKSRLFNSQINRDFSFYFNF